jgi:predicted ATPase
LRFAKLRLNGFKSFVDPTDGDYPDGLTGVVGPNGCGKSNLLEALRWVMGENRASAMRGGGMEDVIFAGAATAGRGISPRSRCIWTIPTAWPRRVQRQPMRWKSRAASRAMRARPTR